MRALVVAAAAAAVLSGSIAEPLVLAQGMRQPPAAMRQAPFPLDDPEAIADGAKRFSASCTGYCHGSEGRVSRAPKLRGNTYDPAFLYSRIADGYPIGPKGPMPAFKTMLSPEEIWKIVAYVMSLSTAPDQ